MANITQYLGTGRRKKSIARVRLLPGTGSITVNQRDLDDYFGYETLKMIARAPLALTDTLNKYDVRVNVHGGGTMAIQFILDHLMVFGMLVYSGGSALGRPIIHLGPVALENELEKTEDIFRTYGRRMAAKTVEVFKR